MKTYSLLEWGFQVQILVEVKKSRQLETDLDASIILTKFNRNLASTTK